VMGRFEGLGLHTIAIFGCDERNLAFSGSGARAR
jgi:hypothetical protein